jgi:hypothetical protein
MRYAWWILFELLDPWIVSGAIGLFGFVLGFVIGAMT